MDRKDIWTILGTLALMISPIAYLGYDRYTNSETRRVTYTKEEAKSFMDVDARVTTWNDSRGRSVTTGGIMGMTIRRDYDLDGKVDSVECVWGAPKRGVFRSNLPVTEKQQEFYDLMVRKAYPTE